MLIVQDGFDVVFNGIVIGFNGFDTQMVLQTIINIINPVQLIIHESKEFIIHINFFRVFGVKYIVVKNIWKSIIKYII